MTADANLFMFRSATMAALHGFADEPKGARLPEKYAPWDAIGVLRPDQTPPHGLPRAAIETGVAANGYQLWRKKKA